MSVSLRQQDETADARLGRAIDHGAQQGVSGSLALSFRGHGQGPDLSLVPAGDDLAGVPPALQHDGAEDPAVALAGHGHQDRAVARGSESAQHRRVPGIRRQVTACPVGGHPDLADLSQLTRQRVPNDHGVI